LFWAVEDLDLEELNELILEEAELALGNKTTRNEDLRRRTEEDEKLPGFWDRIRELVRWL